MVLVMGSVAGRDPQLTKRLEVLFQLRHLAKLRRERHSSPSSDIELFRQAIECNGEDSFVQTYIDSKYCYLFINLFVEKNCLPNVFADYFVLNRNVHSHVTRGNDLHVTVVNKNYGRKSLKHKATVLWNGLLIH